MKTFQRKKIRTTEFQKFDYYLYVYVSMYMRLKTGSKFKKLIKFARFNVFDVPVTVPFDNLFNFST